MDQTTWPAPSAPGLRMGPRGPTCAWSTRLWLDSSWASYRVEPSTSLPRIANSLFWEDCFLFKNVFFFLFKKKKSFSVSLFFLALCFYLFLLHLSLADHSTWSLSPSIFISFYRSIFSLSQCLSPLFFFFTTKRLIIPIRQVQGFG
jgi:hypothetical protein